MEHECSECTFVALKENIFVDREIKEKAGKKPVYIGCFTLPNWIGHARFYLCHCACGYLFVDYPHGYTNGSYLFFSCDFCDSIVTIFDKQIYKDTGTELPPSLVRNVWFLIKLWFFSCHKFTNV